jgi:hypothetical protein
LPNRYNLFKDARSAVAWSTHINSYERAGSDFARIEISAPEQPADNRLDRKKSRQYRDQEIKTSLRQRFRFLTELMEQSTTNNSN